MLLLLTKKWINVHSLTVTIDNPPIARLISTVCGDAVTVKLNDDLLFDPGAVLFAMRRSVLLIVTGASRGLGKAIVKEFACGSSHSFSLAYVALMARSIDRLEATKAEVRVPAPVLTCAVDLSSLEDLDRSIDEMLTAVNSSGASFNEVVLINNAGSIGHIGACVETPSLADMRNYIDLNVTSCFWLSIRLIRFANARGIRATVVNVSSLVALQPFSSLGIYSAGKAAREAYHSVLAVEVACRRAKILNYAPGPLETDMTNEIRESSGLDTSLRPFYEKKLVDPCDSARALVRCLSSDDFESGAHLDFYELPRTLLG